MAHGYDYCIKCGGCLAQTENGSPKRKRQPPKKWVLVVGSAILLWLLWGVIGSIDSGKKLLETNLDARSAFKAVMNELTVNPDIIKIGDLQSITPNGADSWRFEIDAVYRADTGLTQSDDLICMAYRNGSGWLVKLKRKRST